MSIAKLVKMTIGSRNERLIKKHKKIVEQQINVLDADHQAASDLELKNRAQRLRERAMDSAALDSLLPEAYALVREASRRVLGLRHFDVQLVGGIALHESKIAEMRTGEGKTLVATLPAFLNALLGRGVHVITVNDYLAKRDAEWNRPLFEFLGLSVGVNLPGMSRSEKKLAYAQDITYGTNNEFGFDYLRDNMALRWSDRVQRPLYYAILDEVDSILIDEARTPLIISGAEENNSALYLEINQIFFTLQRQADKEGVGDYHVDEKAKQVHLSEQGHEKVEAFLKERGLLESQNSLYEVQNLSLLHHVNAALRGHTLFKKDVEYLVVDDQILIVDEHTGRVMPGRRWSDGLHQAVEAKEGVPVQSETQTLAAITFQNYFRLYEKLSGMTGTADTEAFEFQQIYGLETVVIPTNKPSLRADAPDVIFATQKEKFEAIVEDIEATRKKNQPILVGTVSIEVSEYLSNLLLKKKIPHNVLNAKQHAKEAAIIAEAGRPGTVTIATNMAGRGTDIVLGGKIEGLGFEPDWQARHAAVVAAGGLRVIGTERHESRRIDNQLRGRSARQGDPGSTQFYLSLEDNLMRIFLPNSVRAFITRGFQPGEAIVHSMISRSIEKAQSRVEAYNFDIRKQLLEFDDVANEQRQVLYRQRNELLVAESIEFFIHQIIEDMVDHWLNEYCPVDSLPEEWLLLEFSTLLKKEYNLLVPFNVGLEDGDLVDRDELRLNLIQVISNQLQQKEQQLGSQSMREFEKQLMLSVVDHKWKEHLATMEHLRQGIHLLGYAQKDPKQEYKREAFSLFQDLLETIQGDTLRGLLTIEPSLIQPLPLEEEQAVQYRHDDVGAGSALEGSLEGLVPQAGRNEPCPCGSAKKYKHCHGRIE